ncbi:MAG TPA: hypothetical protein VGF17_12675, partial [Phytomonospora sp.]
MSEPQGQVAGRLTVIVEASLANFRRELKTKVEAAAEGIKAKIEVEVNDRDLRGSIEEKVAKAAEGVKAEVGIDLDSKMLKEKVEAAAKAAASKVTVNVDTDGNGLAAKVSADAAAAEAAASPVRVPLRVRARGFIESILAKRAEGQAAADASGGIDIPLNVKDKSGLFGGDGGGLKMRGLLRGGLIAGLVSLVEPAVGAIGQVVAGLTAMAGAAAPAVGALDAIPVGLAAMLQTMAGGKVIAQGFGNALTLLSKQQAALARGEKLPQAYQEKLDQQLKELSPSARQAAKELVGLRGAWVSMRKGVQEQFFSRILGDVKPLASTWLPLLQKELGGTAARLGDAAHATLQWSQTKAAQRDVGAVMSSNNILLGDFLYMLGQFGRGSLDILVSSRRFARGFGDTMRNLGDWFSGKAAAGRKSGSTVAFLDTATEKASQLWHITRQLGGGLAGIFRAGTGTGNDLLATFDQFLTNWHEWVDSPKGQQYLTGWFEATKSGFIEAARLINDAFKGMAKWAADPKIAKMLHQIRTEFGPALSEFLKGLSDHMGQVTIDFLTELTRTLNHLEPAIEIVSLLSQAILGLVGALNDLADVSPGATSVVAQILGVLLLTRGIGRLGKIGGLLAGIGKGAKEAAAVGKAGSEAAAAAGKFGKLGGVLERFSKVPLLRKAGWIGLTLQAVDIAQQLKGAYDFGGEQAKTMLDGFQKGLGSSGAQAGVAKAITDRFTGKNAWYKPFGEADPKLFDHFHVNVERLTTDMAKFGDQGAYYQRVLARLKQTHDSSKNGLGILPWVETDREQSATLFNEIEDLGKKAKGAIKDALADEQGKIDLASMLNIKLPKGSTPITAAIAKQLHTSIAEAVKIVKSEDFSLDDFLSGHLANPNAKPPGGKVMNWFKPGKPQLPHNIFNDFKGNMKPPGGKVMNWFTPPSTKKWHQTFLGDIPATVRKGMGKIKAAGRGLKNPFKVDFSKSIRQANQWGTQTARAGKRAADGVRRSAQATKAAARTQEHAFASIPKKARQSANQTGRAFESIPKKARQAANQTGKAATQIGRQWANKTR